MSVSIDLQQTLIDKKASFEEQRVVLEDTCNQVTANYAHFF
jgi:hypothetical protein